MQTKADNKTLYLVDGSGYIFRGYYAIRPMNAPDGTPVNAVFGFTSMLLSLLRDHQPEHLVVAFDSKERGLRRDLYPQYKANRPPPPEDLLPQFPIFREVVNAFGIAQLDAGGWEADDLLAAGAVKGLEAGYDVVIITADKDLMQLIRPGVRLFDPMKSNWMGEPEVKDKFGVSPDRVVDVQSLAGDSVDNVPGVPGIGVKTAAELINTYGDLEAVLAAAVATDEKGKPLIRQNKRRERLVEHADDARVSRKLVQLYEEAPFPLGDDDWRWDGLELKETMALFDRFGFRRLRKHPVVETMRRKESQQAQAESHLDRSKYRLITEAKELLQVCDAIRTAGAFAWDTETTGLDHQEAELVGISLAWGRGEAVYIPVGHRDQSGALVSGQLPIPQVRALLSRLLSDDRLQRFAQNWKFDARVLGRYGFQVAGPTGDPMVAAYLLDPVRGSYKLDDLAQRLLQHHMIAYADIAEGLHHFGYVPLEKAVTYAAEDADATLRLAIRLRAELESEGMLALYDELELPLAPVLARMEDRGILLDGHVLARLSEELSQRIADSEVKCHTLAGEEFNLGSPKQLGVILFDKMGLPPSKKTKTGYSTDVTVLEKLSLQGHEIAQSLLAWRHDSKLRSTYTDVLPTLAWDDGRIHTNFRQTRTATGRLASNEPNLQNIPIRTEDGRRIREAFVAAPGHRLISADYSQVELRLLAHLSEDPILLESFQAGEDIHRRTASEIFDVPPLMVSADQRRAAKAINFGIVYGMGQLRLARELSIPRAEAKEYLERFRGRYEGITAWQDAVLKAAHENGYVTTMLGRRRPIPELRSPSARDVAQGERIATNTPVQGSAADLLKLAMIRIDAELMKHFPEARLLLTVHDELVLEVPEDQVQAVSELTRSSMEKVYPVAVPLLVDLGVGAHWGEAH